MEDIKNKKKSQQLLIAIIRGEENVAKKLVDDGAKPISRDRDGKTALILATLYNLISTVNLLADNGCNINDSDNDGWTPLHFAVNTGNLEMTNLLLKKSADPNCRTISGRNSALHIAVAKGFTKIAELLLTNSKVNIKNRTKHTPLHVAVNENQIDAVKQLLDAGANPNTKDKFGKAPLISAIEKNNIKLVSILLSSNSFDVDQFMLTNPFILHEAISHDQKEIADALVKFVPDLNLKNDEGNSTIILASMKGYDEIVESLIKMGCDIDSVDREEWTSLHHATYYGHLDVAKKLLNANLNTFMNTANSVLHLAVLGGHINMIEYLVSSGFDTEFKNKDDQTPLQLAVEESHIECAIKLLELGSNPNVENKYGEKLISCAIRQREIEFIAALLAPGTKISADNLLNKAIDTKQVEIAKMLLENGGYLNLKTDNGFEVMKSALLNSFHPDIFDLLLKHGCKVNAQDSNGRSLLQFVVAHNREDILTKLVEAQVDVNSQSPEGYRPIHFAAAMGFANIIDILASAGADINAANNKLNSSLTPIEVAVCAKKTNSVKKLLELGCDPNTKDNNGISLLSMAISQGLKEMEEVLLTAGATPLDLIVSDDQATILRLVARNGAYIESEDDLNRNISKRGDFQWTALHHAVAHGMSDLCVRFLNAGADPNWTTDSGESTLHIAVGNEKVDLIELLIHYGADIYLRPVGGSTPLEWSVLWNRPKSIEKMLEFHAKKENDTIENICNKKKLLFLASKNNLLRSLNCLLSLGANPNICNDEGLSLLCSAIILENYLVVDILLSQINIDVDIKENPKNETPLLVATRLGKISIISKLIVLGANVNICDNKGETPLSYAVKGKNANLVKVFIEHGAQASSQQLLLHRAVLDDQIEIVKLLINQIDINFANEAGNTPLLIAVQNGNYNIVKFLLENGACVNKTNCITESTILHEAIENISDLVKFRKVFYCLDYYGADINTCVPNKGTPLFRAIELEKDEIASFLIKNGVDVTKNSSHKEYECSNYELALKNKLESTVFYLVLSGFKLPSKLFNIPWSLSHIAKLCIRSNISKVSFVKSVKSLPLPKSLHSYLVYEKAHYLNSQENLEYELREIIHNNLDVEIAVLATNP